MNKKIIMIITLLVLTITCANNAFASVSMVSAYKLNCCSNERSFHHYNCYKHIHNSSTCIGNPSLRKKQNVLIAPYPFSNPIFKDNIKETIKAINAEYGISEKEETQRVQPNEYSYSEYVLKVLELTNKERKKNGIEPLKINSDLCSTAQKYAEYMSENNYLSHTSKDGKTMSDRINECINSYSCAGENIALGQKTPEEVVKAWMNSSGHRANILNEKYKEIGIGYSDCYWVQNFIG